MVISLDRKYRKTARPWMPALLLRVELSVAIRTPPPRLEHLTIPEPWHRGLFTNVRLTRIRHR
jgi:hypothetical protein